MKVKTKSQQRDSETIFKNIEKKKLDLRMRFQKVLSYPYSKSTARISEMCMSANMLASLKRKSSLLHKKQRK
jgi:hypothetical protein